ncbi:hypothetical protein FNH13_07290 [Ornithinimicrobium ciconiae]|uniref:Uncharacterized protein n=1 Tax=Ornithinimicrobium ciconiae TaxID=2594265 RepID=A0A516G9Y8_9MICO|nr:hypothetical protein [Ornithinimicrobium ciconiae]QDO88170.1 hypothetical protein FNH13_07290 [Ornithinimicrobium ciconiae]
MASKEEFEPVPSIAELREKLTADQPRIGTGWPVIDAVTDGIPVGRTTAVRGPQHLRLQVLARMAAWAAGDGHATMIASRAVTTEELWLAVGAGGLGLPPRALLEGHEHDAWIDDRLRVLDLRVFGGHDAHEEVATELLRKAPRVLIIDDYPNSEHQWDEALDPVERRLDLNVIPRRLGCTLVLGAFSMETFSDWLDRAALTVRIVPESDGTRTRVSGYEGVSKRNRTVLLRDGYLEQPRLDLPLIRRAGVTNIWEGRTPRNISSFALTLGADVLDVERDIPPDDDDLL